VNVSAMDAAGNEQTGSFTVTVQDTTKPALTLPGAITREATGPAGAAVTFSVTSTDAAGPPVVLVMPPSGSTFSIGLTTVNVTSTDGSSNVAMGSFSVTVQDTTPPTITGNFGSRTTIGPTLADFTSEAVTSDLVGVTSVTQDPAIGSPLPLGATLVTLTAHDDAGNEESLSFTLTRLSALLMHTSRHVTGGPVPGAGAPGGPPAGAMFMSLGVPAINDAGQIAFVASWVSPIGAGTSIFAGNPAGLVLTAGDAVAGLGGVKFKAFADPVLDEAGHVAFLATLTGPGVRVGNDTVLGTDAFAGPVAIVAREGASVNGAGPMRIKAINDVSLNDGEVLFTAALGDGVLPNRAAAFRALDDGLGPQLVVQAGAAFGASKVKAFKLLGPVGGSPGQSRAHMMAGNATFLALFTNGTRALIESGNGTLTGLVATGDATGGTMLPAATFKSLGLVAADAPRAAFLATLNSGGGVTSSNSRGVFLGEGMGFDPVARVSDPVPNIPGATFRTFSDPVMAPGAAAVAFFATLRGPGILPGRDVALLYRPEGEPLRAIALAGGQPPGTPVGTKWSRFTSLALPGGSIGPIFRATLAPGAGGVNTSNDAGVWAVESGGDLVLIFREGDLIGDPPDKKRLKGFTVLNVVRGSRGVTRSFNNAALVVWRAEFTDHTSAIVVTAVP
ncbi:MAG: choice-of-anchor tandem repeat NxxGxxAF-containing protein, partial [Chthoniobacteraceae bacterium]